MFAALPWSSSAPPTENPGIRSLALCSLQFATVSRVDLIPGSVGTSSPPM